MAFSDKHQCIHCEVTSCQHHDAGDLCQLDAINVKPRCDCHSGKCDESECGSSRAKEGALADAHTQKTPPGAFLSGERPGGVLIAEKSFYFFFWPITPSSLA